MPYSSPLPDIALPRTGVFDAVLGGPGDPGDLGADAALPAITEVDTGRSVTYGELAELAAGVAAQPGEVVALRMPNSIAFAAGLLGLLRAGAVASPIGAVLRDDEAARLAELAGAARTLDDVPMRPPHPAPQVDPDALAVIPFSSGTTGFPKAVELTHAAVAANAHQFSAALAASGIGPGTRTFAPLPFSHIYGLNTLLLSSLKARHHIHTTRRFALDEMVAAHREHALELTFIAPPIARLLAKGDIDASAFTANRFMVCGAAPLDEALARAVEKRLGTTILQGYGTTESSPVTHVGLAGRSNPGTIGFAVPNTEYDFTAEGELLVRGPQLMRGYRGHAPLAPGDWLHTGDLARPNPDGTVTIVDRVKDVFKYHGFQVSPAELEALILTHPEVEDVAVASQLGDDGEDLPWGWVVARGASLSDAQLMAWVAARVAPYKKLRGVTRVEAIPRNAAGKILRRELPGRIRR